MTIRRIGRLGDTRRTTLQHDRCGIAHGAPDFVYILVVHDGEEPRAQIGADLPQMFLAKRADECFLHEVIRPSRITGQCTRIAPEPRDFPFETMVKIGHQLPHWPLPTSNLMRRRNPTMNLLTQVSKML